MQIMLRIIASLLILLFIPVFTAAVFIFSLKTAAYNPNFVKSSLEKANFYETLLSEVLPKSVDKFPEQGGGLLGSLTSGEAKTTVNSVITPKQLQKEIEKTVDAAISYFSFKSDSIKITYNIAPYKKNLATSLGSTLVKKLEALPPCNQKQLQKLASDADTKGFPECKPASTSGKQAYDNFGFDKQLGDNLKSLPDEITLTEKNITTRPENAKLLSSDNSPLKGLSGSRESLNKLFSLLPLAAGAAGSILLLILLLRLPHWRSTLTWVGFTLIISSAVVLILGFLVRFLPFLISESLFGPLGLGPEAIQLISALFRSLAAGFTNQMFLISVPTLVLGVSLIIFKSIYHRKDI